MFPNVRLMAASTIVSVMALFLAFGVYASLRVSHQPLARSSRAAPLQLVGFNVAMLPVTVLAPFADKHAAPPIGDNGSALAYSALQAAARQPAPTVTAPEARNDNTALDEPAENNDVTQMQITEAAAATREIKPVDATTQSVEPVESVPQNTAEATPPTSSLPTNSLPTASLPAPPASPPVAAVVHTATIEATPTAAEEPPAIADDTAVDTDAVPKKKKKKHVARHHFHRAPLRAIAQSSAPPQQSSTWPTAIGGPLVSAPKR